MNAKIMALNRLTRGWCQYYRSTSSPQTFSTTEYELFWDMAHWLGRNTSEHARSDTEVQEGKYLRYHSTHWYYPTNYKAKRLLTKTWHNPYTAKEEIIREKILVYESLWSGTENRYRMAGPPRRSHAPQRDHMLHMWNRLHPSEVEIDHEVHLANGSKTKRRLIA